MRQSGDQAVLTANLGREFKGPKGRTLEALKDVNITVEKGEIFGLLGPNGAGKTTLIKILTTLLLPTAGECYVDGYSVEREPEKIRPLINLVSGGETPGYGLITAKENLWFFSQLYGLPRREALRRIDELMTELGLSEMAEVRQSKLSSGYKQRLNLARGFINDPKIVFLDEPTLGLDVISARKLRRFIVERVRRDTGTSILLTTHYMAEAEEVCDRVAIIDRGRILASGTPDDLKKVVAGKTTLILSVKLPSEDISFLRQVRGVGGLTHTLDVETGVMTLKAVMEEEEAGTRLINLISGRNGRVLSIGKTEPSLEDVYVALMGKGFVEREAETLV